MRLILQYQKPIIIILLMVVTLLVYAPVRDYNFLRYDDDVYVSENPRIQQGLTWENVNWALSAFREGVWNPATWISFMLDDHLFGLNPGAFHLTNLLLHTASVVLLFGVLQQMTASLWPSALVAALFALHPLNVESVAWVTERKNVLSTLLGMLTLWAYLRYVSKPCWQRYAGVLGFLVMGLMAKQMLVTLPCVLLLLDYWPLKRLGENWAEIRERLPRVVTEKLPLFVAVAAASVLTIRATQSPQTELPSLEALPFGFRLANAAVAYATYLFKMVWPVDLAVFYPHQGTSLSLWTATLAVLFLAGISWAVWRCRGSGYLEVGWLWYLGTLVPVSGLIQAGAHSMADRHTYVPLIGVFIMLVWGARRLARTLQLKKAWVTAVSVCVLIVLAFLTRGQLRYWQNTTTLFEHTLQVTSNNFIAHNMMGVILKEEGRFKEAREHLEKTVTIKPKYGDGHINLATVLIEQGDFDEAEEHLQEALRLNPRLTAAHANLGIVLYRDGKFEEAVGQFLRSLEIDPQFARSYNYLGIIRLRQGRWEEAIKHFTKALEIDPRLIEAQRNMGLALGQQGRVDEAIEWYRHLLQSNPDDAMMHNNLGVMLNRQGMVDEARHHFSEAVRIDPGYGDARKNLRGLQTQ